MFDVTPYLARPRAPQYSAVMLLLLLATLSCLTLQAAAVEEAQPAGSGRP